MTWRSIPGFPGYEASAAGHIRRVVTGANGWRPHPLRGWLGNSGYFAVDVSVDGRKVRTTVHRLVCLAFHGEPPPGKDQVAHADGTRTNNAEANLRWASAKENAADRRAHGRDRIGEANPTARLTAADAVSIRDLAAAGSKQRDIADLFGVHQATVHRIVTGKSWRHSLRVPGAASSPLMARSA